MTIMSIARQHGIVKSRAASGKWPVRNRREYLAKLGKDYKMEQYKRLQLRERVHGHIAIWLAKNPRPQTVDQIYSAISVQFQWLKRSSLVYMLHKNSWDCYKRVGERYTYRPPEWWHPACCFTVGRKSHYPEMETARAIYFERKGIPDPLTDEVIEKLKQENEAFIRKVRAEAIEKVAPQLRLMATAAGIAQHYEKHRN